MAGGTDGVRHFHGAVDSTGQWWVSVFDGDMATLLDRWEVTGWMSSAVFGTPYYEGFLDQQHVCASATRVVVVADHIDESFNHDFFGVTVFDLSGTILHQWEIPTPPSEFGSTDSLDQYTGSCLDADFLYFGVVDAAADNVVVKVELATGAYTSLFTVNDTVSATHGIVEFDGDLIMTGASGIARVQQNGTVVWYNAPNDPDGEYKSLAHSGNGSVWTSYDTTALADEWAYDGTFLRSAAIPEETIHGWLLAPPAPPVVASAGRNMVRGGCILGSPDTQVFLMDRCGSRTICDITDSVSFNDYGLLLDNDSECEVSLHFKGDASGRACCECLENARTWRNELMVLRGGKVVWGPGPLVTITIQREIGHLVARDITAWLDVRLVHTAYDFVGVDLTTIAKTTIEDALTMGDAEQLPKEWRDMCILDFATFIPSGKKTDMKIIANQKSAGEVLRSLTDKGLNFTVIKRSLIVGADFAWGPIGPLRDADFQGDLEIGEHGLAAATSWRVASTNKTGKAGGIDPYFGLIERAVEGFGEDTQEAVDREAGDRLAGTNPPPVTINIPTDSALSPKAPICQENLIPGTMVDLAVNTLCRGIQTRQRLTAVDYRNDENGEKVSVTIAPPGNIQLEDTGGGGGGGG
jgi:hypothetical protein